MPEAFKKEKNFVSLAAYVHNAAENIEAFLDFATGFLRENFLHYEFVLINDASTDDSVERIKRYFSGDTSAPVTILNMSYYQGMERAMDAGMELAIGDYVYEFDSLTTLWPAETTRAVYDRCLEGYDIVSACPARQDHCLSNAFYRVYNRFSNAPGQLQTETFRILSRRAINRVWSMNKTLPYRKAVYANCGLPTDAVFYEAAERSEKLGHKARLAQMDTAVDALILYTNAAYRCAMVFSFLMILFTVLVGTYIIAVFVAGKPVPGYVSTIMVLSAGFFGVNVFLTVLIKYTSLILRVVFERHRYVVRSIEKL